MLEVSSILLTGLHSCAGRVKGPWRSGDHLGHQLRIPEHGADVGFVSVSGPVIVRQRAMQVCLAVLEVSGLVGMTADLLASRVRP